MLQTGAIHKNIVTGVTFLTNTKYYILVLPASTQHVSIASTSISNKALTYVAISIEGLDQSGATVVPFNVQKQIGSGFGNESETNSPLLQLQFVPVVASQSEKQCPTTACAYKNNACNAACKQSEQKPNFVIYYPLSLLLLLELGYRDRKTKMYPYVPVKNNEQKPRRKKKQMTQKHF